MAAPGGKGHVDVNERRLRPVYDALDNLNNKVAIQLADKILKKQKDLHCAKALKALALLRSGKLDESTALLEEIKEANSWDDSVLQAMTMAYREMQKGEEIPVIYEMAVKQHPKNEEFLSHLFMAYVRLGNFKKQQQSAMGLYKVAPTKNPYYFWAVMSIFMQALTSEDEKAVNVMLLPLAERMVIKFIKEGKIESGAEVNIYLLILEQMGKYKEALDVLNGELGDKLGGGKINEKEEKEIEYLDKLERWSEVNVRYKDLLLKSPDQWSYYIGYFDSAFRLMKSKWNPLSAENGSEEADHTKERVEAFLNIQIEKNPLERGPLLSKLEFMKRIQENGTAEEGYRDLITDEMVGYFDRFGSKRCSFEDLSKFTELIPEERRTQFMDSISSKVPKCEDCTTERAKLNILRCEICIECLARRLRMQESFSAEEKIAKAKQLMKKYTDGLQYGKELTSTEVQHSDTFLLLAVYLLMDVERDTGFQDMLWHILLILEEAVKNSSSNHQFKILLIHLYSSIGAFGPCMKLSEELEMKYIMLDTLGYKITRFIEPLGYFQAAAGFYGLTLKFYSNNQKDTPEQIIASYRYGAFRKIPEILEFKDRLYASLQFSLVVFEKMHLDILLQVNSVEECRTFLIESDLLTKCPNEESFFDNLVDNRDFEVLEFFDPPARKITDAQKKKSFDMEVLWLRLRCLLLRLLGLSNHVGKSNEFAMNGSDKENVKDTPIKDLAMTLTELDKLIQKASSKLDENEQYTVHGPQKSRWAKYVKGHYHDPVINSTKILRMVHFNQDSPTAVETEAKNCLDKIDQQLKGMVSSCKGNLLMKQGDQEMFNGPHLESIVLYLETSNQVVIMLSAVLGLLQKDTTSKKNRKKKPTKETTKPISGIAESIWDFLDELTKSMEEFHEALSDVGKTMVSKELQEPNISELFEKTKSTLVTSIWQNIQSSYKQSIAEVLLVLQLKIQFAKSLKS